MRSYRGRLALRFGATLMLVALAGSAFGYIALRRILHSQLDRNLHRLAEIEASGAADAPDESVHFHEELLAAASERVVRPPHYAAVWSVDGEPVLRTENLGGRDLPLPEGILRRVATADTPEFFGFELDGRSFRALVYPLGLLGAQHRVHLLQVAAPTEHIETVLGHFLRLLVLLVLGGTVAASALGWWLAGHAVRPVLQLIEQAESLDMARSEHRMTADADTEELSRLVSVLNSMLARIDGAFEHQRRFLADAGHEIKTPLTILRGDVEVALRRLRSPAEYEEVLRQTLDDLRGVSALAEDLITLARSDSGGLEPCPIDLTVPQLLARVAERYTRTAKDVGMRLDIEIREPLVINGDAGLIERALSNLVDNAIRYGRRGGRLSLTACPDADGRVRITVRDDGPGIPADEHSRLFERFYRGETGRRTARGSGLGLAIVKAIVEAHGGRVDLESEAGRGTTVHLLLPAGQQRTEEQRAVQGAAVAREEPDTGKPGVG